MNCWPLRCCGFQWSCAVVSALTVIGCSPTPKGVVPVSGRITLAGKPLRGAVVTFQPVERDSRTNPTAGGSVGRTSEDGRFVLRLIDPDMPGALAGLHTVTITTATVAADDDGAQPKGELVPPAWRNGSKTFDVPSTGTDAANFAIP
jgi:hypothetical protein